MSEYITGLLAEVCTLISAIWVFLKRQFVEYGQNFSLNIHQQTWQRRMYCPMKLACWLASTKHTSNAIQTQHIHNNSHETVLPCLSTSPWIGCHKSLSHSVRYENILAAYAVFTSLLVLSSPPAVSGFPQSHSPGQSHFNHLNTRFPVFGLTYGGLGVCIQSKFGAHACPLAQQVAKSSRVGPLLAELTPPVM